MVDKPSKFPEWAKEEIINDTSGQLNRVEPPDPVKDEGWRRREIPPRQWWNWLANKTYLWVLWFEDRIENFGPRIAETEEATGGNIVVFNEPGVYQWPVPSVLQSGRKTAKVIVTGGGAGAAEQEGQDAENGQLSAFGSFCSAAGGASPAASTGQSALSGGSATGGNINLRGQSGFGGTSDIPRSGPGGASYWGGGGRARTGSNLIGGAAECPGAGAGGSTVSGAALPSGSAAGTAIKYVDLNGVSSVEITVGAGGAAGGGTTANGGDGIVVIEW